MFSIENLKYSYGKKIVLDNLSVSGLSKGELTVLVGPNAAGKSTLFKSIAGLVKYKSGTIQFDHLALENLSLGERLKKVCYTPQNFSGNAALTVFDVVLLAKKNNQSWRVSREDIEAVETCLAQFGIVSLADRMIGELSGGQQQIVSICQALVRPAELYLLDEPTSALDLNRQLQVLEQLKKEAKTRSVIMLVTLHDLNLAARFADKIMVMNQGKIVTFGGVREVITSGALEKAYEVNIEMLESQNGGVVLSVCS